jgi:O-methyltransferase involved in polyketide biosynthesis
MELDPLSRTALIPFWARAQDAVSPRPLLGDTVAAQLAPRVRERFGVAAVDSSTRVGCCLRNLMVDKWVAELVDAATTIVEIGVGLNTRVHRLPAAGGQYIEIDREQIIELRNELLPANGAIRVAGNGMDVNCWAGALDMARTSRVIITLEGVLAYQAPDAVTRFFTDAMKAFPGAYVVFDRLSPSAAARANRPNVRADGQPEYRWPRTDGDERQSVGLLRILRAKGFMDLPRDLRRHLPARDRLLHVLPPHRSSYKLVLCQLASTTEEARQKW